jgi:hypothetical protein
MAAPSERRHGVAEDGEISVVTDDEILQRVPSAVHRRGGWRNLRSGLVRAPAAGNESRTARFAERTLDVLSFA